ncbi:MAG: hypothetical protein RLZZ470_602 [Pseudomonadota bacterium]|jgi:hypothetical protein
MSLRWITAACLLQLSACSDQPLQELFCETNAQQGQARVYKQQIVTLSPDSLCLLSNQDVLRCASSQESTQSAWSVRDDQTQTRELTSVKMGKDVVLMQVQEEIQTASNSQAPPETAHQLITYEFHKKNQTLTVTAHDDTSPVVFVCKPWVRRAWWQLY